MRRLVNVVGLLVVVACQEAQNTRALDEDQKKTLEQLSREIKEVASSLSACQLDSDCQVQELKTSECTGAIELIVYSKVANSHGEIAVPTNTLPEAEALNQRIDIFQSRLRRQCRNPHLPALGSERGPVRAQCDAENRCRLQDV